MKKTEAQDRDGSSESNLEKAESPQNFDPPTSGESLSDHSPILYPPRIMSGVQPTPVVHLGHYFGSLKDQIELHHQYPGECFLMIADYHSMTRGIDADRMRNGVLELATTYLALGLNPNKAILYRQSEIPRITELTWILSCITPLGILQSNPSFRAARERTKNAGLTEEANRAGLLFYPVLMAADILALRATVIPVGHDQGANVERVRDIAQSFNQILNTDLFPVPQALRCGGEVVPGINGKKMLTEADNYIPIFARYDQLRDRINKIKTDSTLPREKKDTSKCSVFRLYSLVAPNHRVEEMRHRYNSTGADAIEYREAKRELLIECQEYFSRFEDRYHELKREPDLVFDVLRTGFRAARETTEATLDTVCALTGTRY